MALLRVGLALSGMDIQQLWLCCLGVGGLMSVEQLVDALQGVRELSAHEHDVIAQALNDHFIDHAQAQTVPYAAELDLPRPVESGTPLAGEDADEPGPAAPVAPGGAPAVRFDQASQSMLDYLASAIPMGFWSVTRYDGERQLYLTVRDSVYGLGPGDAHLRSDSMCQHMVTGAGPQIAPDVTVVPPYRTAGVRGALRIGAYIGVPIRRRNGELFGTLCGLDPSAQKETVREHEALLQLLTAALASFLEADEADTAVQRSGERTEWQAGTDALTGLLNEDSWNRHLTVETDRYHRFGDPAAVLVIDLDQLRTVNAALGRDAGDAQLRQAARTLQDVVAPGDIVARLGGAKSGILSCGVTPRHSAALAVRIQGALENLEVACSIGHAAYTMAAGLPATCRNAAAAMYTQRAARRSQLNRQRPHLRPPPETPER